eukprot:TRINITY_DN489_c0_g1_i2.p1 TRINITY_DN489_c0_g1~~TRINITY_DN489_c0_g1_i2.p1  ORF type:complete len:546 (+),score=204.15 TRINITY_DN489_c0_g1_i2:201-1640(+)
MMQSMSSATGEINVTNDGATILATISVDNGAAMVLKNIAKTQDEEVGDGTTSVTVLTAEALGAAEILLKQHIHPQIICAGYREAAKIGVKYLQERAVDCSGDSDILRKIANTTLSSKVLCYEKEHFAKMTVDACLRVANDEGCDLSYIQIIKKPGGRLLDSELHDGFVLPKTVGVGQPKAMLNADILVANTAMDNDKVKLFGSSVRVSSMDAVAEIEEAEKQKMKKKVESIIDHGIKVFINRQLIYDYPQQLFADNGIMAIEHADFEGVERLAAVLGGEITSTFDRPDLVKLGHADEIREIMVGEDKMIKFDGCKGGKACTIILRGGSMQLLDEAERSLHDALCVVAGAVEKAATVLGGGCSEIGMSRAIEEAAKIVPGKKQLAMEAFASALVQLPMAIADNAGFDAPDLVAEIRAKQNQGEEDTGIDISNGTPGNMRDLGVVESLKLKSQVVLSAAEGAEMILRVDEIVQCAPRQRTG